MSIPELAQELLQRIKDVPKVRVLAQMERGKLISQTIPWIKRLKVVLFAFLQESQATAERMGQETEQLNEEMFQVYLWLMSVKTDVQKMHQALEDCGFESVTDVQANELLAKLNDFGRFLERIN